MSQHQPTLLPLQQLEAVPQPVVVLIEVLLEKDPSRRFQTPAELLKAMPRITGAMDARRRVIRQSLQKTPSAVSRLGSRKSPTRLGPKKISVAELPVTGSDLFGREQDIAFLDDAWQASGQMSLRSLSGRGLGNCAGRGFSSATGSPPGLAFEGLPPRVVREGGTSEAEKELTRNHLQWFYCSHERVSPNEPSK